MNGRYYIGRIILTILLAFSVAGYIGLSSAGIFFNEDVYIDIINEEDLAGKACTALEKDFQAEYNTTMIPPEVYMNEITPEWTVKSMCEAAQTAVAYITNADLAYETDYTRLEDSIKGYFYEYAESIDYEPDEVFEEKLAETIENAKTKINSRLDAFYMQTLKENGILEKVSGISFYLMIAAFGLGAITLILLITLVLMDRKNGWRRLYFSGTGLFAGGALMTIPSAYLLFSDVISSFSIKDPVIYPAITGLMESAAQSLFTKAAIFAAIGLVLIGVTVAFNRKVKTEE